MVAQGYQARYEKELKLNTYIQVHIRYVRLILNLSETKHILIKSTKKKNKNY